MSPLAATASDLVLRAVREGLVLAILLSAPPLLASLLCGFVVGIVQTATQVQDQTLAFVPKLVGVSVVFLLALPWILQLLVKYTTELFRSLPSLMS